MQWLKILNHLNPLKWSRSYKIGSIIAFLVIWFGFLDTYSLYTRAGLYLEKHRLIKETQELQEETAAIREQIEQLEQHPEMYERIAREEYGMSKPGETVYRIEER